MDKLPLISQLIGPLTELLKLLTSILHSYGLAIIVFTIIVRAVLAPLNLRQLHSAKKMAMVAPRIKELQQRHKNDREALMKAQMALYKEEGANPAAGCLPLLIQMPVLYSLFFVFRDLADKHNPACVHNASCLYHQTFLWFNLGHPDHTFILPILAGVTQWIQQRMMMQPTSDPQQRTTQQIMQFMPLMIIFFAINYPAGLALYWVTSTTFSIMLQYFITGWGQLFTSPFKVPEAAPVGASAGRTSVGRSRTVVEPRDNGRNGVTAERTPGANEQALVEADDARVGKMQRVAMRPKPRARTSKGAKR